MSEVIQTREKIVQQIEALQSRLDELNSGECCGHNDSAGLLEGSDQDPRLVAAYATLHQSEANLVAVVENTKDLILSVDRSCRILTVNSLVRQSILAFFGTDVHPGMNILEKVPPEIATVWKARYDRALQGERFELEEQFEPEGQVAFYDVAFNPIVSDGAVTGVAIFSRDITRRKLAEESLRERLDFEAILAKTSSQLINLPTRAIDKEMESHLGVLGMFMGVDRACITELPAAGERLRVTHEWTGPGIESIKEDYRDFEEHLFSWYAGRVKRGDVINVPSISAVPPEAAAEAAVIRSYGTESHIAVPLIVGGEVYGFVDLESSRERVWSADVANRLKLVSEIFANALARKFNDIAVKKADIELRKKEAELAHVARLSTMGEMVSGITHELSQPLTAILNYSNACSIVLGNAGSVDRDQLAEMIEAISDTAEHASAVLFRLKSFVTKAASQRTSIDLAKTIESAISLVKFEARQLGVAIDREIRLDLPSIAADSVQIEQVLVNLLRNAFEALEEYSAGDPHVMISAVTRGDVVEIAVADNGPGISKETSDSIFDAFVTTKPEGMGLGLPISTTIVEAHGGKLMVGESLDGGAVFKFTLTIHGESANGSSRNTDS